MKVKTSYSEEIKHEIQNFHTYASIGRKLGISRERVRQIAKENRLTYTIPAGYLLLEDVAKRMDLNSNIIRYYMYKGKLPAVRIGNRCYVDGNVALKLPRVVCGTRV